MRLTGASTSTVFDVLAADFDAVFIADAAANLALAITPLLHDRALVEVQLGIGLDAIFVRDAFACAHNFFGDAHDFNAHAFADSGITGWPHVVQREERRIELDQHISHGRGVGARLNDDAVKQQLHRGWRA